MHGTYKKALILPAFTKLGLREIINHCCIWVFHYKIER